MSKALRDLWLVFVFAFASCLGFALLQSAVVVVAVVKVLEFALALFWWPAGWFKKEQGRHERA